MNGAMAAPPPGRAAQAAPAPIRPTSFGDIVYVAAEVTNDRRFDGMSRSDNRPSLAVTGYYGRSDGLFLGTVISQVDFRDAGHTSVEIDVFGGRRFRLGGAVLNVEALYAAYPDQTGPGPGYAFFETKAEVSRNFGRLAAAARITWSPAYTYDAGRATDVGGSLAYSVRPWLKASVNAGRLQVERGQDRTYGDIGATASWKRWSLDLRYVATNLEKARCYDTTWCEPAVVATVAYRFAP